MGGSVEHCGDHPASSAAFLALAQRLQKKKGAEVRRKNEASSGRFRIAKAKSNDGCTIAQALSPATTRFHASRRVGAMATAQ
jgi:hypothetical protein